MIFWPFWSKFGKQVLNENMVEMRKNRLSDFEKLYCLYSCLAIRLMDKPIHRSIFIVNTCTNVKKIILMHSMHLFVFYQWFSQTVYIFYLLQCFQNRLIKIIFHMEMSEHVGIKASLRLPPIAHAFLNFLKTLTSDTPSSFFEVKYDYYNYYNIIYLKGLFSIKLRPWTNEHVMQH
jgi:hypothetical protein